MAKEVTKEQFLKAEAKELFKPARKRFLTRRVIVFKKDYVWGVDLADMSTWADDNDGTNFILTTIDVFTRWAAARPLKTKKGTDVRAAFESICKERTPEELWSDKGTEFINKEMDKWRKANDIGLYHTYGPHKSAIVERFNRTLKTMMWKKLSELNSHRWIDILPELIAKYNSRPHSAFKLTMSPNYASANEEKTRKYWLAADAAIPKASAAFKVGDWVRISRVKGTFEKGYDASWSREIFKIDRIDTEKEPARYYLKEYNGDSIAGAFYKEELQKVKYADVFLVEKVLERRGKKVRVKWLGWSDKYNSWIDATDVVT